MVTYVNTGNGDTKYLYIFINTWDILHVSQFYLKNVRRLIKKRLQA